MSFETATAAIGQAVQRRAEAQALAEEAAAGLSQILLAELVTVDGDDRQRLLHHVYWNVEHVLRRLLEAVAGGSKQLRDVLEDGPVLGVCDTCGEEVRPRSRSELWEVQHGEELRCRPCRQAQRTNSPGTWTGQGSLSPGEPPRTDDWPEEFDEPPPDDCWDPECPGPDPCYCR